MRIGLREGTIRVFEPNELAPEEKERLLGALEAFVNLGDTLEEFLAFGKQNPTFFPVRITDPDSTSREPLPEPCFKKMGVDPQAPGREKIFTWTKLFAWEPACHKMALSYRHDLRSAWHPPYPGPIDVATGELFLRSLGLSGDTLGLTRQELLGISGEMGYLSRKDRAWREILVAHPNAVMLEDNTILADWKTGNFLYKPDNEFQRAAYILFREGWRAKVCEHCSRRFIADKPVQRYCSTSCSGEIKRQRHLEWWNKHGRTWRAKRKAASRHTGKKLMRKKED